MFFFTDENGITRAISMGAAEKKETPNERRKREVAMMTPEEQWEMRKRAIIENRKKGRGRNRIRRVIFNPPATIILWGDGERTAVKTQGDEPFDPEKGMALAIVKRLYKGRGHYFDMFREHCDPWREEQKKAEEDVACGRVTPMDDVFTDLRGMLAAMKEAEEKKHEPCL